MTISTFLCLTPPPLQLMCWEKKVGILLYFNTAPLVLLTPILRIPSDVTIVDRRNTDVLSVRYIRNMSLAKKGTVNWNSRENVETKHH